MTDSLGFGVKVLVPASGVGVRFGGDTPKQFLRICGEPILKRTLEVLDKISFIDEIVVAVPEGFIEEVKDYSFVGVSVIKGMPERSCSVYAALKSIKPFDGVVLVHDGIRLFVTENMVRSVAMMAFERGAALAVTPMIETVKVADDSGVVIDTPDRGRLWRAQTPQGFRFDLLKKAFEQAEDDGFLRHATDDSSLVERLGHPVHIVQGDSRNMKITTMQDFHLAQALFMSKDEWDT